MTEDEFDSFIDEANAELRQKQAILLEDYGLGNAGRWHFEQATGNLQFFDSDETLTVEADVINIGSYSPKSNSWKWAWSNDSVLPWLRESAEKLQELESITGMTLFGNENTFTIEGEPMAWEIAAVSVAHLSAAGCYRAPSSRNDGPITFLAIMSIKRVR